MAVRCKECAFVSKKNEGFCSDCGAMYVEPLDIVDDALVGQATARPKPEKKKSGGLFSSLFGSKNEAPESTYSASASTPVVSGPPGPHETASASEAKSEFPEGTPREQVKIRCRECEELTMVDDHDGYCPNCGAFYVDPHQYVTPQLLAAEREVQRAEIEKMKQSKKSFDQMDELEKSQHLAEKVQDTWDQIIKDRHVLNQKANECMQCFTAAGTINSDDQFEVMDSMIVQRYKNLEDFEILNREYQKLLKDFNSLHDQLKAIRQEHAEQQERAKQAQVAS